MLHRQGPPGFDPYRTLQLDPSAPHPLIVEAYWMLVERAQRHASVADAEVVELNAAYNLLVVPERRRAYDAEEGLPGPAPVNGRGVATAQVGLMRWRSRTRQPAAEPPDYYRLLRVSPDADRDVINLAYAVLSRDSTRPAVRAALRDAHRTLAHPYLRARYDARMASSLTLGVGAAPALRHSMPGLLAPADVDVDAYERRLYDDTAPAEGVPPDAPAAAPARERRGLFAGRSGAGSRPRRETDEKMAERLFDAQRLAGTSEARNNALQATPPVADHPVTS